MTKRPTGRRHGLAERLRLDNTERDLRAYREHLAAINAHEPELKTASDARLREAANAIRKRAAAGSRDAEATAAWFGLVREVAARTIGERPFDVQMLGGLALLERRIVQMQTGEGKTLVAVAPAALNALAGQGVHVLTFNDYLARRDAEWMGPIYRFLGLSVRCVQEGMAPDERRAAYAADITYVTAKEAGFDHLRDGLVLEPEAVVQRPLHMALIDEADSIMIDEARIPLVIAGGQAHRDRTARPERLTGLVEQLDPDEHWRVDRMRGTVHLTDAGISRAEALLGCGDLHTLENVELLSELNAALYAIALMQRDVDYIVRGGRVELVDEFTGRVVKDRQWPDGLQAAVEAKERLGHSDEGRVLGQIALQYFLQQYPHLCGMTATAEAATPEFSSVYDLGVTVIPPNRPCIRVDHPDSVFADREAKLQAVADEIARVHATGRPILVGTVAVDESERLAARLRAAGVSCDVLNAKQDDHEARIVAQAGRPGAVTISTNMAGRGTDIRLGGAAGAGGAGAADAEKVAALGGLYVIGTNRHESRRVDDQLRGRAGRQGDPGSSRFFVSLEDPLLQTYGVGRLIPTAYRSAAAEMPQNPVVRQAVTQAQRIVDARNFDVRQELRRYSYILEVQRQLIRQERGAILAGEVRPNLRDLAPERYKEVAAALGGAAMAALERRLALLVLDEAWADHLAAVEDVREEIHLVAVGGLSPLTEFRRRAVASFEACCGFSPQDGRLHLAQRIAERFAALPLGPAGPDLGGPALRGPASTWTYVLHTDAARDPLAAFAMPDQTGMAAAAAATGPLMLLWALAERFRLRRPRKS